MACPKCGCRTTYQYDDEDDPQDDRLERCAACGEVFDVEDHAAEIHRLEAENAALREWIAECRDTVLYPVAHADTEVGKRAELLGAATVALLRPNAELRRAANEL